MGGKRIRGKGCCNCSHFRCKAFSLKEALVFFGEQNLSPSLKAKLISSRRLLCWCRKGHLEGIYVYRKGICYNVKIRSKGSTCVDFDPFEEAQ